ncbi:lysylphosphatidylglycerol synthase domain-containing protein [Candidatus Palauibacter sp.]|uniref:lysylphosphatidylglycerol synthase domain-containing protein n=1 Tax=Candidatus Palauibacter sp. TaxID=3101350 RepID=UPI003B01E78F
MNPDRAGATPGRRWVALGTAVFLLAALAAVGLALSGSWAAWGDFETAGTSRWRVRPLWLTVAVACEVVALCASGAVWAWMFRAAGGRAGIPEAAAAWLGSNLGRYLPGKIWQVAGLVAYMRGRGDSGATAFATLMAFQAAIVVTGVAVALGALGAGAFEVVGRWPLIAGGVALAAALAPPVLRFVVRLGRRVLRETAERGDVELDGGTLCRAVAGSLLIWVLHGLGFLALLEGLVLENTVGFAMALGIFAGSYVVGYLALVAPGGLIVREGAIVGLLAAATTIPAGPAAALALAARLWTTVAELASFGLALVLLRSVGAAPDGGPWMRGPSGRR